MRKCTLNGTYLKLKEKEKREEKDYFFLREIA